MTSPAKRTKHPTADGRTGRAAQAPRDGAKVKKGGALAGRVAAFLRGSFAAIARGHRAALEKILPRESPPASDRVRKEGGTHGQPSSAKTVPKNANHRDKLQRTTDPSGALATSPSDMLWIETGEQLAALAADLRAKVESGALTRAFIDTEADSLHHYVEKLCLIQIAAGGTFALIDTLALADVTPLLEVLDRTELWLHGADYDLTLLKKTYGWSPRRIYDTQIAARLCGHRPFGLAALVERHCGVVLCKSSQKADWSQRPLPAKMQAYAVDDVRYLGRLADIFMRELTERKRLPWFEQSCAALRGDVLKRPDRDREDAWRISGCGRLKPAGLAALRELWLWRDSAAREKDVPPFKVLNNQQLLAIAAEYEEHGRASHPPRWRSPWREGFRAALDRVRHSDPATWPQQPRRQRRHITEAQKARIEKLCAVRDRKAEALGLESSLLGSRATIEEIVLRTEGLGEAILMPWQREILEIGSAPRTGTTS